MMLAKDGYYFSLTSQRDLILWVVIFALLFVSLDRCGGCILLGTRQWQTSLGYFDICELESRPEL